MQKVEIRDLQSMAYSECWDLQRSLFDALCAKKAAKTIAPDDPAGTILLVEHPAVYTLGKARFMPRNLESSCVIRWSEYSMLFLSR